MSNNEKQTLVQISLQDFEMMGGWEGETRKQEGQERPHQARIRNYYVIVTRIVAAKIRREVKEEYLSLDIKKRIQD